MPNFLRRPFRRTPDGTDSQFAVEDDDNRPASWLRRLLSRRETKLGGILLLLVVIGLGAWLVIGALDAKSNLEQARNSAQQAKDALLQGDTGDASKWADEAHSQAQAARDATHSLPWNIAAVVPWLGSPFKTGQQISDVVLGLAADVLRPSADVSAALSPDRLLQGGRVNVQLLRDEETALSKISADASRLGAAARAISDPTYLSLLRDARSELQEQTLEVTALLENTALAARVAPSMLGADGPRTYFMAFQTNAELRGTGGLLGGFGILRFDNGTPTVDTLGTNRELVGLSAPIDLGPEFVQQYGFSDPFTDFRNSNQSSHFPYAAQIWSSMWTQQSGMPVDGVIAIDPVALSYILGAVGSVTTPEGEVVTADNVVELTESTAYARFPAEDQTARKQYLQDIANAVVEKVTDRIQSPRKLLDALGKAVGERRIAVWSSSAADQKLLEETPLAHVVPDDPAPYAEVVINNLGGNKLDYYLDSEIEYAADGCDGEERMSTVTVRLTNTLQDAREIPEYVGAPNGQPLGIQTTVPIGTMVSSIRLLATTGATLVSAVANGQRLTVFPGTERGHPTFEAQVAIPPGQSGEMSFHLSEPTSPGAPRAPTQPLVDNTTPEVSVPECSE